MSWVWQTTGHTLLLRLLVRSTEVVFPKSFDINVWSVFSILFMKFISSFIRLVYCNQKLLSFSKNYLFKIKIGSRGGTGSLHIDSLYSRRCVWSLSSKNIFMITDDIIVDSLNVNSLAKLQLIYFTPQLHSLYLIV